MSRRALHAISGCVYAYELSYQLLFIFATLWPCSYPSSCDSGKLITTPWDLSTERWRYKLNETIQKRWPERRRDFEAFEAFYCTLHSICTTIHGSSSVLCVHGCGNFVLKNGPCPFSDCAILGGKEFSNKQWSTFQAHARLHAYLHVAMLTLQRRNETWSVRWALMLIQSCVGFKYSSMVSCVMFSFISRKKIWQGIVQKNFESNTLVVLLKHLLSVNTLKKASIFLRTTFWKKNSRVLWEWTTRKSNDSLWYATKWVP